MSTPLHIALTGYGKMGKAIEKLAQSQPEHYQITGVHHKNSTPPLKETLALADVIIDFTRADFTDTVIDAAVALKKPLLIGTTGLTPATHAKAKIAAAHIPLCIAPNTSLAVTILAMIAERVSSLLGEDYDIEITETHHRDKIDAPSGTALMLGNAAAKGRTQASSTTYPHEGTRTPGSIGFAVSRGGGVFGDHSIRFLGDHDVLELSHRALSRDLFAKGALILAKIIQTKPNGLYSPRDLL